MPFGLKNATSTFTITMFEMFKDLGSKFLKVFVDDLNVHSESWEEHLQHLDAVLCKLREVNLKLNPNKCCFAAKSITFLGHVVSKNGTRPDPGKVEAVLHFPQPRTVTNVRSFLGLTGYYRKYIRSYARLAAPLFELTRKDVDFVWDEGCQQAFQSLRTVLVEAPILIRPDFKKPFCLDVDWSSKGVEAILSQKEEKFEKVIAYASKSLIAAQKRFHPMEGECYALIWGIMHFRQYLYRKHFILRTDHKPLEWLATVSDANGRCGRWIDMLQDFSFKIMHRPGIRHTNVDALSRNPVGSAVEDDDFCEEIQDIGNTPIDTHWEEGKFFFLRTGIGMEWLGSRRKNRESVQHHICCFGINHPLHPSDHHLYMIDLVSEDDVPQESAPGEGEDERRDETAQSSGVGLVFQRTRPRYYDKRQQLELVLAAQRLFETGEQDGQFAGVEREEGNEADSRSYDIWEDNNCMELLQGGTLPATVDSLELKRARKRMLNYRWHEQLLYFKGLLVPKLGDRMELVVQMHKDLGHSGEERTLAEVCRRYFWHDRTENVKAVVRMCQHCQMVKKIGSVRSEDEELKNIPVCDLFHRVAMDTAGPLPETKVGNRYLLVAIDHYSKWCEAKVVADHGAKTAASFLEDDVICRYGVPKFILTDNGGEWAAEFDNMCKDYGIQHQHTAPQWPQCNGMVERLIKTIKHGITVLAAMPETVDCWDEHLAKVLFGYRCGIQSSTKFSPYMILTGRTPRLRADNYLQALTDETDENIGVEAMAARFLQNMKLVASIDENVLSNIERA
jgi:hypothetical protein